jgi:dolichol-phosphate mannosyltransferase
MVSEDLMVDQSSWEIPEFVHTTFAPKRSAFCVCIPVINEGERIKKQLEEMCALGIPEIADILIVDNGSTDGSLEATNLQRCGVRTLLIKAGPGRLSAQLRIAYSFALLEGYEGIVTVDGNNKDGTEAIPRFINELKQGTSFVQGSRFVKGGQAVNTPWLREIGIRAIHAPLLSWAAGFSFTDTTNGFRGYNREYLLDERVLPFRNIFQTYELLTYLSVRAPQLGYTTKEIPVKRAYPAHGPVPTKLNHNGHLQLLKILIKTVQGDYNPPNSTKIN